MIKSYTDLSQSKKLAEILPLESADMYYPWDIDNGAFLNIPIVKDDSYYVQGSIDCWSLAALLDVLKDKITFGGASDKDWFVAYTAKTPRKLLTIYNSNLVDACVTMVERLNELNLL